MLYKAKAEKRISTPVVLEIKLEVVSRPGVLFCETNAAANGSKASESPRVIRFEVVKATSSRAVPESQRPFYQGEVLVPDNIPPHLIKIPNVDAFSRPLEHSGRLPDPNLVMGTLRSETEAKASKPSSIANQHLTIAAGAGSSTPKPRVSPIEVFIAGDGKSNQETFTASEPVHSAVEVTSDCTDKPAHSALLSAPTSPSASLVFTASATGGVVAVRADGDCCYHLCGVFGDLMRNPEAVQSGSTPCLPAATAAARVRMMSNINEYTDLVKSSCVDPSEVDGAILENFGELPSSYVPRITGIAKEKERLGEVNDFAAYTANTPFQVMVIDSQNIWSDTSDADLRKLALRKAEIKTDTDVVKSRVLCAVLHNKHYDLGVVRSAGSIQAVFAAGPEWEAAVDLILAFVRSKMPSRGAERKPLCQRWVPPAATPVRTSRRRAAGTPASASRKTKPGRKP
jgi:hypothetical protein